MLETVDLKAKLSKEEYQQTQGALDLEVARLQRELHAAGVPVIVVFEGWETAGKGTVMSRLLQALDPRGFKVHTIVPPTEEERLRPAMWRFWVRLPAAGTMAFFDQSWYSQPLLGDLVAGLSDHDRLQAYERIRVFERQLADDGAVIVKFFLHISKKEQAKRFKKLEKDPAFAWKIDHEAKRQHKKYEEVTHAWEDMLRETSTPYAPWALVPAHDQRFAQVHVSETLVAAMKQGLTAHEASTAAHEPQVPRRTSPLDHVDLTLDIADKEYKERLSDLQEELRRLQHLCYVRRKSVVMVYEGWDAAGKGGNIRRLTRELDPRGYEVLPFGAPQGEERTHHYLWRFWKPFPKAGHFAVYDRSWYGRVLVERVEGFAKPEEWFRAFREINEFEAQITEFGTVLIKFWIHISKDEQLRRFEARQQNPDKQWKITDEDWRNREKWDAYWDAVSDMLERTSTVHAPWTIVEGTSKHYARVRALQEVVDRVGAALDE